MKEVVLARPCNCDPLFRHTAMPQARLLFLHFSGEPKLAEGRFSHVLLYVLIGFSFAESVGPFRISMWNFRCEIDVLPLFLMITSITKGAGKHTRLHDIDLTTLEYLVAIFVRATKSVKKMVNAQCLNALWRACSGQTQYILVEQFPNLNLKQEKARRSRILRSTSQIQDLALILRWSAQITNAPMTS